MSYTTYTIADFLRTKFSYRDKINAIDLLIDKMLLSVAESIDGMNPSISEYQMDDGQIKVKTVYRSIKEVQDGVHALETLRNMYENRLRGRVVVLKDEKTFRR